MIIGEIVGGHGDQAVADRLPAADRLFECHAFTCPSCGNREHGNPTGAAAKGPGPYIAYSVSDCPPSCWVDPARRPPDIPHGTRHCVFCAVHVPLETHDAYQDRHYHLRNI